MTSRDTPTLLPSLGAPAASDGLQARSGRDSARVGPGDQVGTPSRWARLVRSMIVGARFGAGGALGLWLGDVVVLAFSPGAVAWRKCVTALAAAFDVALTTALVVGALLGIVVVPVMARAAGTMRSLQAALRGQCGQNLDGTSAALPQRGQNLGARHAVAAKALALAGVLLLWIWGSYRMALTIELRFMRPDAIAGVLTLSQLVLAAAIAVAWPSAVELARALVDGASSVRRLRWLTARAWRVPGALAAMTLGAVGALLVAHRTELAALPWRDVASLPGLALGLAGAHYASRDTSRAFARILVGAGRALIVLGLVCGTVAAAQLRPEATTVRRLAFDRALSGRVGYAAWTAVMDFDGDGQIGMLGGGDCAPFDPRRHTGARDIPGNGIDEDCDGVDQPLLAIRPRPRIDVDRRNLPLRPTIVLVTVDGLAAPRVAAGGRTSVMPHLDELAERSVLFTHCFAQGPSTRLSFPSMFTSRWDSQLTHLFAPQHPYPLAPSERQLQDVLGAAGYETVAVIPNPYFDPSRWRSVTRGFQRVDASPAESGKHNAPQVTDAALRALAQAHDRPLYLWVHYFDAHGPYQPLPGAAGTVETEEALYDAELGYIDHELARLIAALDARAEPAVAIFTADHASVFHPSTTRRGHYGYDLHTATLHVPLIVHGPGLVPGPVGGVVSTMDIAPTIADLLRLSDSDLEGTSLLPEMLGTARDPSRVLFHEFYLPERDFRGEDPLELVSVRSGRYDLVLDRLEGTYQLYDWNADYFEEHELYEDQARSSEVVRLRSLLGAFVEQFHRRAPGAALGPASRDNR
jgi:arylsulfatase A-like enzyme